MSALVVAPAASARGRRVAAPADRCAAPRSTTLLQTSAARIYRQPIKAPDAGIMSATAVYGCWRASGRKTRLTTELLSSGLAPDTALVALRLADDPVADQQSHGDGSVVGFLVGTQSSVAASSQLFSVNLKAGKIVRHTQDAAPSKDPTVSEFVVTPAGSLAWIGSGKGGAGCDGLHAIGADGIERDLDCGAPKNLAYANGTVYWTGAAVAHSTMLA